MLFRLTQAASLGIFVTVACGGSSTETSGTGGAGGGAGTAASGGASGTDSGAGGSSSAGKGGAASGGKGGSSSGGSSSGGASSGGKGGAAGLTSGSSGEGGASGGSGAPNGTGGVDMTLAPTEVARAACAKIYECCSAEDLMNLSIIGGGESSCQLVVAAYIALQLQTSTPAFDDGRLGYDGAALEGMIDDLESRECDMLPALEELDLSDVLVPMVEEGGECGLDYECIEGYCDGGGNATSPQGTCAPLLETGDDCSAPTQCASGYCDMTCGEATAVPLCSGS